jgi:hypothetical protein
MIRSVLVQIRVSHSLSKLGRRRICVSIVPLQVTCWISSLRQNLTAVIRDAQLQHEIQ